jgi:hypothetical protein
MLSHRRREKVTSGKRSKSRKTPVKEDPLDSLAPVKVTHSRTFISSGGSISDQSETSSVEETIGMVRNESNRRKTRTRRIRYNEESDTSLETSESSVSIARSRRQHRPHSIMQVRTLRDSLEGSKLAEIKKKRRQARLNVMGGRDNFISPRSDDLEGLSSASSQTVQFDQVTIQEYAVIPGDNPAVSSGPPLALDWDPINRFTTNVNTFEKLRRGRRRRHVQMKMPTKMRVAFLLQQQYSFDEIDTSAHEAGIVRKQRIDTINSLGTAEFEERIESLRKMISKPFRRKKSKDDDEMRSRWNNLNIH